MKGNIFSIVAILALVSVLGISGCVGQPQPGIGVQNITNATPNETLPVQPGVQPTVPTGAACIQAGYITTDSCCNGLVKFTNGNNLTYCVKADPTPTLGNCVSAGERWIYSDVYLRNCCQGLISTPVSNSSGYCVY